MADGATTKQAEANAEPLTPSENKMDDGAKAKEAEANEEPLTPSENKMNNGAKAKEAEATSNTQGGMGDSEKANVLPPVTAKDVQGQYAPPSYDQVFGENQTSIVFAQPELPPLAYIDIMPRVLDIGNIRYKKAPTFDTFTGIVNGANVWLQHHPHLLCWKCETVERRIGVGNTIDLDSMSHHESGQGFNVHVLGLRIWFVRKMDGSPVQQLGLLNIVPEGNMSDCINKLNFDLKSRPLPGTVLNVETATLKYTIGYTKFDPDNTCFSEMGAGGVSMRKTKQIVRVFYVLGPTRQETIYMHEIHPIQVRFSGSKSATKFQSTDGMIAQAQQWLQAQSGIRVVNIETRDVQAKDENMKITIYSEKTDEFLSDSDCMFVRILRIFFVNTPEVTSYATTVLTSRLFTPMKLGSKGFEGMGQLMNRIVNWMQMTQLPIFSVETLMFPAVATPVGCQPERVDYRLVAGGGKRWLYAVRLYFPVPFQDPTPVYTQQSSGSCVLV